VPFAGIRVDCQGQPRDEGVPSFFRQIMGDLALEAGRHTDREPVIGLFVDERNEHAIHAYKKLGFEDFLPAWNDKETGRRYKRMLVAVATLIWAAS
jgi:hypothetical protein